MDTDVWAWVGSYGISALMRVADQIVSKHPKFKYLEKPISQLEDPEETDNNESKEECAVYEMKQRIKLLRESGLPESPD